MRPLLFVLALLAVPGCGHAAGPSRSTPHRAASEDMRALLAELIAVDTSNPPGNEAAAARRTMGLGAAGGTEECPPGPVAFSTTLRDTRSAAWRLTKRTRLRSAVSSVRPPSLRASSASRSSGWCSSSQSMPYPAPTSSSALSTSTTSRESFTPSRSSRRSASTLAATMPLLSCTPRP